MIEGSDKRGVKKIIEQLNVFVVAKWVFLNQIPIWRLVLEPNRAETWD